MSSLTLLHYGVKCGFRTIPVVYRKTRPGQINAQQLLLLLKRRQRTVASPDDRHAHPTGTGMIGT